MRLATGRLDGCIGGSRGRLQRRWRSACAGAFADTTTAPSPPPPAPPPRPQTRTVAEHAARWQPSSLAPMPTAAQRQAVLATTQRAAMEQLLDAMPIVTQPTLAAPALLAGHADLLRKAAARAAAARR